MCDDGSDGIRKINAQIRYYFKIDPDGLDDVEWANMWNDLIWVRQEEAKQWSNNSKPQK